MTDRDIIERLREFPYVYFWNRMDRKGQRCAVTARGKMNSCRVEFQDGFTAITIRNAIRRADRHFTDNGRGK